MGWLRLHRWIKRYQQISCHSFIGEIRSFYLFEGMGSFSQRAAAVGTEERHAAEMKRMLLDVDRERVNTTKLQKELEQARRMFADLTELHRQQISEKQQQAEGLRQRNGELEGSVAELRGQRDQLLRDMDGLRLRLESLSVAKSARVGPVKAGSAGIGKTKPSKQAPGKKGW